MAAPPSDSGSCQPRVSEVSPMPATSNGPSGADGSAAGSGQVRSGDGDGVRGDAKGESPVLIATLIRK